MSVVVITVLLLTGCLHAEGQRYDQCSELRQCEQKIDNIINLSSRIASYECRELVNNLNCIVKSISCLREEERDNYGMKIRRARDQHSSNCDSDDWTKRNNCYDSNEMRRCEENFPRRSTRFTRDNCIKFEQFRGCVNNALSRSCRGDDNDYVYLYLLDTAVELPWRCPQYSSTFSPSSPSSPSWPSGGRGPYNHTNTGTGTFNEEICCKNERCNKNRMDQCRDDLNQVVSSRDTYNPDLKAQCGSYLNRFNCYLWHNYQCQREYEKDTSLLQRAKEQIERRCDARGDIQRTQCYSSHEVRSCEDRLRNVLGRSRNTQDVACRDYQTFYDCVERHVRRSCNSNDELLFGFYMVDQVKEKAWTCSYSDSYTNYPTGSDSSQTTIDNSACENKARQNYKHCDERIEKFEEEARNTANSRERHIKSCCSALTYRECVRQVVRQQCFREIPEVVDMLMGSSIRFRLGNCGDVNYSTCSGTRILSNILFLVAALIFTKIYFK